MKGEPGSNGRGDSVLFDIGRAEHRHAVKMRDNVIHYESNISRKGERDRKREREINRKRDSDRQGESVLETSLPRACGKDITGGETLRFSVNLQDTRARDL